MMRFQKITGIALACILAFGLCACSTPDGGDLNDIKANGKKTVLLTEGFQAGTSSGKEIDEAFLKAYNEFAAGMFREAVKGGAKFLSPYSAYVALAMVMNSADGETLAEMQKTLGLSDDALNAYLKVLADRYNSNESVMVTNSVWFNGDFREMVRDEFLSTVAGYYSAEVYSADFADRNTVKDMNAWVKRNTKDRIEEIIERLDPMTVSVLFNCLTFDGKWSDPFEEEATKEADFHKEDGSVVKVSMMSGEAGSYFEGENYVGISKSYEGGYCFRAYLPKEGTSVYEVVESLNGERLINPGTYDGKAYLKMPKFKYESDKMELVPVLQALGIRQAFDTRANFNRLTKTPQPIMISDVYQKTFIETNEEGTKAAAVTVIEMRCYAAAPVQINHEVVLDRPFVYAICDEYDGFPLFIGIYDGE